MVLHYDTEPNLFRVQVALEVTKFRERIAKYVAFFRRGAKLCIRMYEYVLAGTFVSTFALRFELRCTVLTHDFAGAFVRAKIIIFGEEIWRAPARTQNGHFLLQLLEDTVLHKGRKAADDDIYVETPVDLEPKNEEGLHDRENKEVKSEYLDEAEVAKAMASAEEAVYYSQSGKKKMFWELFVDQGNLSKEVAKYPGMECSTFTLPEWDFVQPATQCGFLELMRKLRPSHLWVAPPCAMWSFI